MNKNPADRLPEIMAPVSNFDMLKAAVHNGANSVYIGMPGFNARARSKDLSFKELKTYIDYAHFYNVKVYLAFNILVFEDELESTVSQLHKFLQLPVDAIITQDVAVATLIKQIAPEVSLHASTQMTITHHRAIEFYETLGFDRVNLSRELSIEEIEQINRERNIDVEVFVHGALCVAFSGQCLTSEKKGGRSANRGVCAQACRLPYRLKVDGKDREKVYVLSPSDLCTVEVVDRLADAGVAALKIEGRYKSPEYVAATVRAYRSAVDAFSEHQKANRRHIQQALVTYSRNATTGWLKRTDHQKLVSSNTNAHTGLYAGKVSAINKNLITINLVKNAVTLKPGDGLLFINYNHFQYQEQRPGGRITRIRYISQNKAEVSVFQKTKNDRKKPCVGDLVFMTASTEIAAEQRRSFNDHEKLKTIPVTVKVHAVPKKQLMVTYSDSINQVVEHSGSVLQKAKTVELTAEVLKKELAAIAGSGFKVTSFKVDLENQLYISAKELRSIKRNAIEKLKEMRKKPFRQTLKINEHSLISSFKNKPRISNEPTKPVLHLLLREPDQVMAVLDLEISRDRVVYLDFEHGKDYAGSLDLLREAGFKTGIATTRIIKPFEEGHIERLKKLHPDYFLVRSPAAFRQLSEYNNLVADFSFNVSNSIAFNWYQEKGFLRITPSYDLSATQVRQMLQSIDTTAAEITLHQYMPAFHMNYCVFARFLSQGNDYRNCGLVCEKHRLELSDDSGHGFMVKTDMECRNTLYHATAQTAAAYLKDFISDKVSHFRFEALFEEPKLLQKKITLYQKLLEKKVSANELIQEFSLIENYGISDGQLSGK